MTTVLELRLPPRGLWVTELALTMLSIICNGRLRISESEITINEPVTTIGERLEEIYQVIQGRRIPVNPKDSRIMNDVLKSLGIHTPYQDPSTLKNLVDALKRFLESPSAYPDALNPMKPLTPFKAEYKEFMRGFGGFTGSKTVEGLLIPPLIQALGLIGLLYTEYYRVPREGKSAHLLLLEKEFGEEYKVYEPYNMVHKTLAHVLSQRDSQYTTSLTQLLASLTIASNSDARALISDHGDVFATAILQGGGRGGYTLVAMEPLVVSDLVSVFSMLDSSKIRLPKLCEWTVSLALAGFGAKNSLAVTRKGSLRTRGEEIEKMRQQIRSVLEKYASNLTLYARTGCRDLAYAAARTVWALARTEDASRTLVYIQSCIDKEDQGKRDSHGGWQPLVRLLEELAGAASEIASVVVRERVLAREIVFS